MSKGRPTPKAPQNRERERPLELVGAPDGLSPGRDRVLGWLGWLHDLVPFRKPLDAPTHSFRLARVKAWIPALPPGATLFLVGLVVALALDRGSAAGALAAAVVLQNPTARATFALLGWFPVRIYGALGDDSTNDTAAIDAAVTACAATSYGGVVYVSPGKYRRTTGLAVPTAKAITLQGAGRFVSKLKYASDLGAGQYAVKPADTNVPAGCQLIDLGVEGINTGAAFGVSPASMNGIDCFRAWDLTRVKVEGFRSGIVLRGDHNLLQDIDSNNNFNNVYFASEGVNGTNGDQRLISCELESAKFACIAVAEDNFIDGVVMMSVHLGGPFGLWKEGAPPSESNFLINSELYDVTAEGIGNAIISCENGNAAGVNVLNNVFEGGDTGDLFEPAIRITGFDSVSDYGIVCGDWRNNEGRACSWFSSIAQHSSNGLFKVNNLQDSLFDYHGISNGGVPTNLGSIAGVRDTTYKAPGQEGQFAKITDTGGAAIRQLLALRDPSSGTPGLKPLDQVSDVPWGVARAAGALNKVIPVVKRGRCEISSSTAPSGGQPIRPDPANTGKVIAARGGLEGSATWDPASVAAGAQATVTLTVSGASVGDPVAVGFSQSLQGMQLTGYVSSTNTVTVVLRNGTAGALDLASGTLTASVPAGPRACGVAQTGDQGGYIVADLRL